MRASRIEVETISVPHAEISTAGVIIALSTLNGLFNSGKNISSKEVDLFGQIEILVG